MLSFVRTRRVPSVLPVHAALAALAALTALAAVRPAAAATFTVNRSDDPTPRTVATTCLGAANDCSLREAVIKANATAGADTILFAASTNGVPLTLSRTGNDANASAGDLDINDSVTIAGNGAAQTIIQGATSAAFAGSIGDKVIGINQDGTHKGLTVSISGVTIRWGRNTIPTSDPSFAYTGGGVDVFLTGTGNAISFTDCVITGNESVTSYGGGVNVDSGSADGGATDPVGVFRGTVTFTRCTISGNKSERYGGGLNLFADNHNVVIDACTIQSNTTTGLSGSASGGGVNARHTNGGLITIKGSTTVTGNTAAGPGGGLSLGTAGVQDVLVQDTTVSTNTSLAAGTTASAGGGIYSAGATGRSTTFTNVTVSGNVANAAGSGGAAPAGGGLLVDSGSVTVNGTSAFTSNSTGGDGGGVAVAASGASVSMTGGSISSNSAKGNGGGLALSNGGAATLSLVTLASNTANSDNAGGGDGGAIHCATGGLTAHYCRFAANTANTGGGGTGTKGIRYTGSGTLDATNCWWGGEGNPGTGGTDTVSSSPGSITTSPRLRLTLSASPTTVAVGGPSALTASFLLNSAGTAVSTANLATLIGLPITFGAAGGGISGAQATVQGTGTATATFTGATPGSGSATAQVDALPAASAAITVLVPVVVQTSPAGRSFSVDGTPYSSAQSLGWTVGTSHTIATTTPQTAGGGAQYFFASWSDGLALSHGVTAPATATTYTATFTPCPAISVSPTFLPSGSVGATYLQPLGATGGAGSPAFSLTGGTLPTGLTLTGGAITSSGAPLGAGAAGSYPITVTATDTNGCTGSRSTVVVVSCAGSTLAVSPATLPLGTAGSPYAGVTFTATGATSFTEYGALPSGLTFTTPSLAGTPGATGVFPLTVVAQDGASCPAGRSYYLAVAATCPGTTITLTPTLPSGSVGQPYDQVIAASGGTAPYRYVATGGALPDGLQLDPDTGHLAGTPTSGAYATFTVTALDANGCPGSQLYNAAMPVGLMEFTVR